MCKRERVCVFVREREREKDLPSKSRALAMSLNPRAPPEKNEEQLMKKLVFLTQDMLQKNDSE